MKRWQNNITLNKKQLDYVNSHFGKMSIGKISAALGIGYGKIHNNLRLMGKVKTFEPKKEQASVIEMRGYFDVDKFGKNYTY